MGIQGSFTGDFTAIDLRSLADDLLAEVIADHAQQIIAEKARANALVATSYVPYTVAVNGRVVFRGRGEIMAPQPIAVAIRTSASRYPVIDAEWQWEQLDGTTLERAIVAIIRADMTLQRIRKVAEFARIVLTDDQMALFRFLMLQYIKSRYPQIAEGFRAVKDVYRVYRRIKLANKILSIGGGKGEAGDADASVLVWIAKQLKDGSPVMTGAYRDAHALYGDGHYVMDAANLTEDSDLPEDVKEWSFANPEPYARKIEFGKTKAGRSFVISVEDHLYERTVEAAQSEFGDQAEFAYEMRAIEGDEQTPQRDASPRHNKSDVRFPTIVVRF